MWSIVKAVIGQDETVSRATSSYVDDIFVNESVGSAAQVKTPLERFGLTCKNPEQLSSGARVLGVYVWEERVWIAFWKWSGDQPPVSLKNRLSEYPAPKRLQGEYERELQAWIKNGWLIPYPESEHGPPKGLIPLMAILQESKQKVRSVIDYRELNEHVNAYTANADVCAQTMREWRQQGPKAAIVDLRRAYQQIHVDKSLWPFQTVKIKGQRYVASITFTIK